MTDPTPAEALKACPNPECQSGKIDVMVRNAGSDEKRAPQGYCECWDCGVRGPMTGGYSGAPIERCTEKAKSEAAVLWNAFAAALPSPATDAGEARAWRDGVEAAAKLCDARRAQERSKGNLMQGHVADDLAAAIRGLAR